MDVLIYILFCDLRLKTFLRCSLIYMICTILKKLKAERNIRSALIKLQIVLCHLIPLRAWKLFWNSSKKELLTITNQYVYHAIRKPLLIKVLYITFLLPLFYAYHLTQLSKLKPFLIDSHPEKCSKYVPKILFNVSLNVLIKKVLIKNKVHTYRKMI